MAERQNLIEQSPKYSIKGKDYLPEIETRFDGITHYHFPKNPREIMYGGKKAYLYLSELQTRPIIDKLSLRVNLRAVDHIIVFQQGADWTFRQLAKRQSFDVSDPRVRHVITKRENGGHGVKIINPEVLSDIDPMGVTVGIEDLIDRDVTTSAVLHMIPSMHVYAPVAKRGLNEVIPSHVTVIATIDPDKWIGGIGSDYGSYAEQKYGYEVNYPRSSGDILVMPESLHDSSIS